MQELSWPQRGRLWLRLGLRLLFWALGLWPLVRLLPPFWALFSPFLLAFLAAWALSPAIRWLHTRFQLPRQLSTLALLLLVFAALGGILWALVSAAVGEVAELAVDWQGLLASLEALWRIWGPGFPVAWICYPLPFKIRWTRWCSACLPGWRR